jgi:hypothetical protein
MTFVAVPTSQPQVALALGRRFGNAVERNRGRRRLRAAFRAAWMARPAEGSEGASNAPALTGAFLLSGSRRVLTDPFEGIVSSITICLDDLQSRLSPAPAEVTPQ